MQPPAGIISLEITDFAGEVLWIKKGIDAIGGDLEIPVTNLRAGYYQLRITDHKEYHVHRFFISH